MAPLRKPKIHPTPPGISRMKLFGSSAKRTSRKIPFTRCTSLPGIPAIPPGHYARAMRKNIRIENPVSGCEFTSKKSANCFVAQARAEWGEGREIDPVRSVGPSAQASAQKAVDQTRWSYDRWRVPALPQFAEMVSCPRIARVLGLGRRKGASRHTFLATAGF